MFIIYIFIATNRDKLCDLVLGLWQQNHLFIHKVGVYTYYIFLKLASISAEVTVTIQ